ncbi:MAG: Smr/MutS family protein [Spirochaetes bacterium]|nr:Smr/MutS family protein [Spirochaetota bacterium]
MSKIKLDLHDIFNKGDEIDSELNRVVEEAVEHRIPTIEIICGKGSGQLKKHVQRFLLLPRIKNQYHRVENDGKNNGRIFVHFKHDNSKAYH